MANWKTYLLNTLKGLIPVLALVGTTWINAETGVTGLTNPQEMVQEHKAAVTEGQANAVEAPPTVTAPVEVDGKEKNIPLSPSIFAALTTLGALLVRLKKSP